MQKYLQLNDIVCYKRAFHLSNVVWKIVIDWDWFAKKTMGVRSVTAIDSVSANITEGFGRYGKKDKIKFYYYSFGSVKESLDWNEKAKLRKLVSKENYEAIVTELKELPKEIHHLIKYTNEKLLE